MPSAFLLNKAKSLWGKKWRFFILFYLSDGPKRFTEIKAAVPGCSVKVLTQILKEMEKNKLIIRKQYLTIPVKVTYELDPDLTDLSIKFKDYYVAISLFFYKNAEKHQIPQDVLQLLKEELDTKE
jgi:DNA-binding HxlR family transcriptional regulator